MAAVVALSEKVLSAKSIICDIEGTTTSISFVKDILFPYALKNVEEYLKKNWTEDATKTVVAALREQAEEDKKAEVEGVPTIPAGESEDIIPEIVKNVEWQMSQDRKTGSLKTLQGLVWAKGYKDGTIKGHVYDDVQKAFEQWTENGRKIYIYSSGSVDAQKLLFEHSEQGNLLKYLAGHYDTKIGAKREKESYESILKNIESSAEETLFLTDVYAEAKAAKDAGLHVVLLDRPGNVKLSEEERKEFTVISTFSDLSFEAEKKENGDTVANGAKRKIEEATQEEEEDQAQEPPSKLTKIDGKTSAENGATDDKSAADPSSSVEPVESKSADKMEVDGGTAAKNSDANVEKVEKMEEDTTEEKSEGAEKMDLDKNVESVDETVKLNAETSEKTETVDEKKETEIEKEDKVVETEEPTVKDNTASSEKIADENDGEKKDKEEVKTTAETQKDTEVVKPEEATNSVVDKVEATVDSVTSDPVVEEKKDEEKVKETHETEKESKTVEESATTEVSTKSDVPVEKKVADEAKKEDETIDEVKTDKVDCEKTNDDVVTTTTDNEQAGKISNEGETEESKATEVVNGAVTEAKSTTNGSSAGDEEKNGSDSDKENDTSLNNCEAEEANAEKTNGTAAAESTTNAEDVTSTEIKAKKVIEPVTAAVTPAPPIEAES